MAEFGYHPSDLSGHSNYTNWIRASGFTLSEAASVSKLSVFAAPFGYTGHVHGLIYAGSVGAPDAKLAVTDALTFVGSESTGWFDLPFPSPVSLAAGYYFLEATDEDVGLRILYLDSGGDAVFDAHNVYGSEPDPFLVDATGTYKICIYATYTPVSSTPPYANVTITA